MDVSIAWKQRHPCRGFFSFVGNISILGTVRHNRSIVGKNMGKKVFTINERHYIVDDDTGEVLSIEIKRNEPIPPGDIQELIKVLAKESKKE